MRPITGPLARVRDGALFLPSSLSRVECPRGADAVLVAMKIPRRLLAIAVAMLPVAAAAQASAPADSAISAAERAADAWFALLANRDYAGSWAAASKYFREHVSREQWRVNAEPLARQFERTSLRRLVEARWLHDEPPLPPAEYVVLRWLTDLGLGRQVGERIIMAHEADGAWRPATYDLFPNVDGLPYLAPDREHRTIAPAPAPPRNIARPGGGG